MKGKLPKVFKKKWLAALRSGEYEQGLHNLYRNGTYCCLGVGCVVNGISLDQLDGKGVIIPRTLGEELNKMPEVLRGSNLKSEEDYNPIVEKLTDMNDIDMNSFDEIADYIEENY